MNELKPHKKTEILPFSMSVFDPLAAILLLTVALRPLRVITHARSFAGIRFCVAAFGNACVIRRLRRRGVARRSQKGEAGS